MVKDAEFPPAAHPLLIYPIDSLNQRNKLDRSIAILFRRYVILAFLAASFTLSGCASDHRDADVVVYRPGRSSLLFGGRPTTYKATEFGRNPWPATTNGYETVERRTYFEYYQDNYGNAFNEQNTPVRRFRSFSTGTQLR